MQIQTTRFGPVDVPDDQVITFTQPILGFQEFRRFTLLEVGSGSYLKWLQSTESPELAFLLMDPRSVVPDYAVELRPSDLSELAVGDAEALMVFTLVVAPGNKAKVRTNLKAPVLINPKHRLAKQVILDRSSYPIQYFLAQGGGASAPSQEVSHARTDP